MSRAIPEIRNRTTPRLSEKDVEDINEVAALLIAGAGTLLLDWQNGEMRGVRIQTGKKTQKAV